MSASRHSKIPTWGKHFGFGEKHPQNTEKTRCWKSKPAPIFYNPIYNIGIPITPVYNNTFPCGMFGKPKTSIQSEFPTEELDFGAQNGCSSATWFAVSISASFSTEMKSLSWPFCTGCHQQQLTKTQKKTKQHPNLSQTCSNAPEATQGKQASLWPPEAYLLEGFQIYNLEKHTSQLGFAHFIQPQTIPTKWYVKSTTSACELARVSNMARTRASLRWNVSPMAFSSCSTSWFSSCWFWIQKNQHFLP